MLTEYADYKIEMISLGLTKRCNLNCEMCWQKRGKEENKIKLMDLSYDDFIVILDKLQILSPNNIYLWGGEPLLHHRIIDVVREIKKRNFLCHLITNGVLIEKVANELIEAKLDTVSISLDGVGQLHDSIRGINGTYDRVIAGLKLLVLKKKMRPIISINTVITENNYLYLYEIVKEFSAFNVNGLQLQFPVHFDLETGEKSQFYLENKFAICATSWHGFVKPYDAIDIEKLDQILIKIQEDFPKVGFYPPGQTAIGWFGKKKSEGSVKCIVPWTRVNIEPNGDMNICTDYPDIVAGNLLDQSFKEIWDNQIYRKFRQNIDKGDCMPMCKYCTYSYLPRRKKR